MAYIILWPLSSSDLLSSRSYENEGQSTFSLERKIPLGIKDIHFPICKYCLYIHLICFFMWKNHHQNHKLRGWPVCILLLWRRCLFIQMPIALFNKASIITFNLNINSLCWKKTFNLSYIRKENSIKTGYIHI